MSDTVDDLANLGPQIVFGLDTDGRCTFSVGPGLVALGLAPGELVGQDLFEFYSEVPSVLEDLTRARAGEGFVIQQTLGGRLLRTLYQPVHRADGSLEGSVGVTTDLTDHVQARDDLSKFKALADDSPDFVAIADPDGRLTYVNPRIAELDLSLDEEDLSLTVAGMLDAPRADELVARLASGERWSDDLELHLPTGDIVVRAQLFPLYDTNGSRRLGTGWIAQDITELRVSEATLRATNADLEQFRALVEASSDFIAIAGLDGAVRYLNPAGREIVGLPPDLDVSATSIRDYLTPEATEQSDRVEQPAVVAYGRWHGESTLQRVDGTPVPVEIASFLIPDPATGAPSALATVQRDITARLAASVAQEEFVALVAHELRTPLASVKGYVEIAGESLESQPDLVRLAAHLKVASRNVVRMERLVEQILRVAAGKNRHGPDRRRPLDLVAVVEQAVESARPVVENAGHHVEVTTCPSAVVALDETFFEVIDNLVSNAAKYTPAGGEIGVTVTCEGGVAVLSVTDTGPGIPPQERATVFDKFVRGQIVERQAIPGLGLGLFITRAIVLSHEGEITCHERAGGGTRFVVRLPLYR